MAFSVFSKVLNTASKAYDAVTRAPPPWELIVIDSRVMQQEYCPIVTAEGKLFSIFQHKKSAFYHVIYIHTSSSNRSVFRTKDQTEALDKASHFEAQALLFQHAEPDAELVRSLVSAVHSHPGWEQIHYACTTGHLRYLKMMALMDPQTFTIQLHAPCHPEARFPLQIACECGHVECVRVLVTSGADPSTVDVNQMNAVHFAAHAPNIDVLQELSKSDKFAVCVNALSDSDQTPLMLALEAKRVAHLALLLKYGARPEIPYRGRNALQHALTLSKDAALVKCVESLARANPLLVVAASGESGDTCLHSCSDSDLACALVEGCWRVVDIDTRSGAASRLQTPLHRRCMEGKLDVVISLLSHGASPTVTDSGGCTPLHYAAQFGHEQLVRCLLCFGADASLKNTDGLTPFALASKLTNAQSRKTISDSIQLFLSPPSYAMEKSGCDVSEFSQTLALSEASRLRAEGMGRQLINAISLDGGGIRGLVLIQILIHIETLLGRPLWPEVGWAAGTSTGAILAIALSIGRSLRDCQRLYFRFKDQVFRGSRVYDTNVLESFLQREIGVDMKMSAIQTPKLMVTAVKSDLHPVSLILYRNYQLAVSEQDNERMGFGRPDAQLVWEAARCSSAAPTYFESYQSRFVDGGLVANNPTLDLLTDVHLVNAARRYADGTDVRNQVRLGCVVSVGTGQPPEKPMNSVDVGVPSNVLQMIQTALAANNLKNILVDQVTAAEGRPVDRSRAWCHQMSAAFFRFSPPLSEEVTLDETKNTTLVNMIWETEHYLRTSARSDVMNLVDFLKIV